MEGSPVGLRVTFESSFWRELEGPPMNRTGSFFSVQVCQMPEAQPTRLPAGKRDLETHPVPPTNGIPLSECWGPHWAQNFPYVASSHHSGSCVCSVTLLEPFNASFLGEVYVSQLETQTEYRRLYSARVKNLLWASLTYTVTVMSYMERNSNRHMERKYE